MKWVNIYNGSGEVIATVNANGEMRSIGPANDQGRCTPLRPLEGSNRWRAVDRRKFSAKLEKHLTAVDGLASPPPEWQAKVHAECDKIDEQTRHDVAESVARHGRIGEPFATEDYASHEPHDPPADDDELTRQVAYCPPGSVRE